MSQAPPEILQPSTAWTQQLDNKIVALPRTMACLQKIEVDPILHLCLPKKGAIAGQILKHVYHSLDMHLQREAPSIYKVGFTHDPSWRFHNAIYGYCKAAERWEGMVILFISHEPYGPAFVEAATIQRHLGRLAVV